MLMIMSSRGWKQADAWVTRPKPYTQPDIMMKGNISVVPWLSARARPILCTTVSQLKTVTTAAVIHMPMTRAFMALMPTPSWNQAVRTMTRPMGTMAFQKAGVLMSPKSLLAPYSFSSEVV